MHHTYYHALVCVCVGVCLHAYVNVISPSMVLSADFCGHAHCGLYVDRILATCVCVKGLHDFTSAYSKDNLIKKRSLLMFKIYEMLTIDSLTHTD